MICSIVTKYICTKCPSLGNGLSSRVNSDSATHGGNKNFQTAKFLRGYCPRPLKRALVFHSESFHGGPWVTVAGPDSSLEKSYSFFFNPKFRKGCLLLKTP